MSTQIACSLPAAPEPAFVDLEYNIAAYQLAELLGIDDMLPVYVGRKWGGDIGSLSWWLPVKMDEVERHKLNLQPPDPDAGTTRCTKFESLTSCFTTPIQT